MGVETKLIASVIFRNLTPLSISGYNKRSNDGYYLIKGKKLKFPMFYLEVEFKDLSNLSVAFRLQI
jgi:hypothetical protein